MALDTLPDLVDKDPDTDDPRVDGEEGHGRDDVPVDNVETAICS